MNHYPHPPTDLKVLQNQFLENLKVKGKSFNTTKNYKTDLDCFNYFLQERIQHTENLTLHDIGVQKIKEYDDFLYQKYPQSSNSRRRRVQALRLFFDYLMEHNLYADNPIKRIAPSPKKLDDPQPTSLIQIEKLWNHLKDTSEKLRVSASQTKSSQHQEDLQYLISLRNQIILLLIYEAGLKVSDLENLQIKDILKSTNDPRVLIHPPQRDPYSIPLTGNFLKYWEQYLKHYLSYQQQNNSLYHHAFFHANPYKIISGGISARGLELMFKEWSEQLEIKITPKSLRQSCLFKWLHADEEESVIKEWMGVAPNYQLKPYKDFMQYYVFQAASLF